MSPTMLLFAVPLLLAASSLQAQEDLLHNSSSIQSKVNSTSTTLPSSPGHLNAASEVVKSRSLANPGDDVPERFHDVCFDQEACKHIPDSVCDKTKHQCGCKIGF